MGPDSSSVRRSFWRLPEPTLAAKPSPEFPWKTTAWTSDPPGPTLKSPNSFPKSWPLTTKETGSSAPSPMLSLKTAAGTRWKAPKLNQCTGDTVDSISLEQGCEFYNQGCKGGNFREFCSTPGETSCTFDYIAVGHCIQDNTWMGGCSYVAPQYDCSKKLNDAEKKKLDTVIKYYLYYFGKQGKCM